MLDGKIPREVRQNHLFATLISEYVARPSETLSASGWYGSLNIWRKSMKDCIYDQAFSLILLGVLVISKHIEA